jgi:uncharacterized protein YpuA (DUF1002 family)
MKKRNVLGAVLCSVCLVAASSVPAMADAMKVVTLGADLSEAQQQTMLKYFKVDTSEAQIMYITNEDEVRHLSSYIPREQIGTRTVSCAYVKPTTSGGIKVRTANLNYVTCNMIATTLSTSGVTNCEVVAACPFEVSGTGALTGVIMAYQTASGEKLDETKVELATQEMVITGELGEEVGQDEAVNIVNEAKMEILSNNVQNADEIYNIVIDIADQNNMMMSAEQLDQIVVLLEQIAQQDYNYEDMKETLENVEANVNEEVTDPEEVPVEEMEENELSEEEMTEEMEEIDEIDSIIDDLDESILGEDVIAGSTEDPTVGAEVTEEAETTETMPEEVEDWGYVEEEMIPEEEYVEPEYVEPEYTEESIEGEEMYAVDEEMADEELIEEEVKHDITLLSEDAAYMFEQTELFCTGEYLNDPVALEMAMPEAMASVTLSYESGEKVYDKVLDIYYNILLKGTDSYVPSETDLYFSTELNMIDNEMKKVFRIIPSDEEDILPEIAAEYKTMLYEDTMKFFEMLYGESLSVEDVYEEMPEEYVEDYEEEYVEEYTE